MTRKEAFSLLLSVFLVSSASALFACKGGKAETGSRVSVQELFASRCTGCHEYEQATRIHGSEESILQLIQRMRKKGARISEAEAMDIAGFLSSPSRHVFEQRCTKCHGMDRVLSAHGKGMLTLETVRKMKEKQGAEITDQEEATIEDHLRKYYLKESD